MSQLATLVEMGFPAERAEKALRLSGNEVENAMEWLLAHSDDPEVDTPLDTVNEIKEEQPASGDSVSVDKPVEQQVQENEEDSTGQPKSLQCDECGKKFRSDAEVEFHAIKSGHKSFSESTEEVQPLTEEQRQDQLKRIEEKIKQRRMEREENDRKTAIEKEKERRRTGQEIALARQRLEEEEQKREAELRRREKLEAKLARQKILEDIERDKQARKEKFALGSSTPISTTTVDNSQTVSTTTTTNSATSEQKQYLQCKLQIRLTNGQVLTQTFGSNEEFAAVRLYVQLNRTDGNAPFALMTNFPKKVFGDDDMSKPLSALGLVPSAVLIVTKQQ